MLGLLQMEGLWAGTVRGWGYCDELFGFAGVNLAIQRPSPEGTVPVSVLLPAVRH